MMLPSSATISCIIPTCDRPDFLAQTIKNVLAQQKLPDEILVINNGEHALELPQELSTKVTVYNLPRYVGAAQARNFGASLAAGDYLAFIDDDDLWHENYLVNIQAAIAGGAEIIISRLDRLADDEIKAYKNAHQKISINNLLIYNPGITGSNIVVYKKIFLELGGFNPKLPPSEDKSLVLEALLKNKKIITLPDNAAIIREHGGVRLTNHAKMAEGIYHFIRHYGQLMTLSQKIANWLKIHNYRWRSGHRLNFWPFVCLYLITSVIKLLKNKKIKIFN